MRRLLSLLLVSCGLFAPGAALAQNAKPPKNVIIVIADDLGMQLGCYGDKVIRTPNIDALANRGVRFARAYATVSSCSPSRASILTGLFTHQNGQYGLQHPPHSQQTHPWVMSLPNLLRAAGYWTGIIGKIHIGPQAVYNFHAEITKGLGGNRDVAAMARAARDFIGQRDKRPLFLVYAFGDPHRAKAGFGNEAFANDPKEVRYDPKDVTVPPHLPDQPEVRKGLAEYYQSITRMDRGVGLLIEALREAGVLDDTLIIFLSDNGMPFPGAKTTLYAAGIHLPLIVAGPGVPAGRTNHGVISFVDIAPTVLDAAQVKGPKYKLPGRSLLPILGEDHPKGWNTAYASHQFHEITMYYPMRAVITDRYKLIVNLAPEREYPFASDLWGSPTWQGIRSRKDKMMGKLRVEAFLHRPAEELYDLSKDAHELQNRAPGADPSDMQALIDLRAMLRNWQQETNDPWLIVNREQDAKWNR
jgi:N-sulfoglucosamine sulfohydrolase